MSAKKRMGSGKRNYDSLVFWMVILVILIILWSISTSSGDKIEKIEFSGFLQQAKSGNISSVEIEGQNLTFSVKTDTLVINGKTLDTKATKFKTVLPDGYAADLVKGLSESYPDLKIEVKKPAEGGWLNLLITWLPLVLIFVFWIFIIRQMQGGAGNKAAFSFGKSKAKLFDDNKQKKVTFKDVAGVDEAKEELTEIIEFLRNPKKFQKLGGRIPKGALLVGSPGSGKTLLAKAVAGEAEVPFLSISGSDFVELFVGVGASRVRDLFEQGKKLAPCLIFIDEIDAVGRHRGAGLGGGHDEREQTLNQLLVEMDGFDANEGIIVIAATNRPDILDPALLRPGRFDRRITVTTPDVKGREAILKIHAAKVPLKKDVELALTARSTPGFSGADLANLINEAALKAAKEGREEVLQEDVEYAKDKVMMGSERRSMIISNEEKNITAYHEAGHALVALLMPDSDPIHKVTIIPRGIALGLTQQLPTDDRYTLSRRYLDAQLAVLMGGRIAEEVFLGTMTTGAGNDLKRASSLARKMVCEWGMSPLGPIAFEQKEEMVFLGKEISSKREYSEATAVQIDQEVKEILLSAYQVAKKILSENRDVVEGIAKALLERESLGSDEIAAILRQEKGDDAFANVYKVLRSEGDIEQVQEEEAPPVTEAEEEPKDEAEEVHG
ncbi:MAG TPA: ATP-dependent zinc metalloprotease FtsH [Candidatus Aminicenantes bacterium]|nr:ATP-dependent zinc metalloprotease FtsH [Candidatus Aminicenantes bacterium]HPB55063.1 ATP-dependent zinc metalloprotease FtsH [Candidatus Aminicenantes bacterium]HPS99605.1 ATP-dependent zinc metalloprotease FtsH [Candidatus Aminicenantes bacterium]